MFERPVGTNARPQGHHPLLARPPGIFCCAKALGLGSHFGAKSLGCPGGMVTGQIDTCIISMLEGIIELNQFEVDDQITKTNKLRGIIEITLNLDELNNSNNLKNGSPAMNYSLIK